jgi:hypothetical protein
MVAGPLAWLATPMVVSRIRTYLEMSMGLKWAAEQA